KGLPQEVKDALPRVFRELLTVDENGTATRQRARKEQVAKDEASRLLMERLIEKRLLVTSSNEELVEVAHEALFRSWPELAKWIAEAQEDLILLRQVRAAAVEWWNKPDRSQYNYLLWPDERLKLVYEMQKRLEPNWEDYEQEFIRLEVERLWDEIENPDTAHRRRSWIGERLDTLGDPRPGVGLVKDLLPLRAEEGGASRFNSLRNGEMRLWGDKPEHKDLPDIVWVRVDGGSIQIEEQSFKVQSFYIAKYPVTYGQFESFVEAEDGFKNARWWKGLSADEGHKSQPDEQNFKFYNHPRENVSWYDAIAFCRWLNARLGFAELPADLTIQSLDNFKGIRLPAEWEWQWAATGGDPNYQYPWGTEWEGRVVNTSESGLGRTTAVGVYPQGSAKCGALDLSGNVLEWCLNEYEKPEMIGLSSAKYRVLRGGSWNFDQGLARASSRYYRLDPNFRNYDFGFRLVVRPPSL
ncbi:MAG: hypothetical protein C3F07_10390, partial [Anaerolineales bacterium]